MCICKSLLSIVYESVSSKLPFSAVTGEKQLTCLCQAHDLFLAACIVRTAHVGLR